MTHVIREQEIGQVHPSEPSMERAIALEARLRATIDGEVRFDDGSRALYATDASVYRQVPIGVVVPRTIDDIIATVEACRNHDVPVLPRGCGTSLAGQCCNVAVVIDCSKHLNQIIEIDRTQRHARVQPGVILDHLRTAAMERGLLFGPDTATHKYATLGGMIGNNSCGVRSVLTAFDGPGARTADNVEELEILTYDGLRMRVGPTSDEELERIIQAGGRRGEIYAGMKSLRDRYADLIRQHIPDIPRRVSGYNLDDLLPEKGFNVARALVGSEGTLATVLEATVTLVKNPPERVLLLLGYPSVYQAADHISEVMAHRPTGCEGIDSYLLQYMKIKHMHLTGVQLLPEGDGWLLVEFGGDTTEEAEKRARALMRDIDGRADTPTMRLLIAPDEQEELWEVRESGLGATAFVPAKHDTWPGWEDSAVAPEQLGDYLRDLHRLYDKYGYDASLYGHFGQGCVHTRIDFELRTAEGIARFKEFTQEAAELLTSKYKGSLSGEHGDGQARGELLETMFGRELVQAFREFKSIWDPGWKMNPGKVIDPYPRDVNLRLGTHYQPWRPQTHFQFPDDEGSFARATLRCVGVGQCRRHEGGTMCPSFMGTHEEQHTTRGRAHLLFEMLQGDLITKGWRDESVKESLDLCLACKGCKSDCPVNVDLATYKAEFLSHYYAGRLRPRSAYAFGLIFYWARLAALMPRLANFFTQTPGLRDLAKFMAGVAPERRIPRFAAQTFTHWFRARPQRNIDRARVILWPDTFNNHFHPETAQAAVEVLEDAGFQVVVPERWLCCGRPLYDYGMLNLAKRLLSQIIDTLRDDIRAGTPIVGLEPSCTAVFRDELINLFPQNQDARRLSQQTYTLGEFLEQYAEEYRVPQLHRRAIVQGHCHHQAIMSMESERALLRQTGLDFEILDSGCCGMAGAFGFEKGERYEVSIKCGEQVLLPTVRNAAEETLIIADGFSCREQIAQATERRAIHLAQALQMALREGAAGPQSIPPEHDYAGQAEATHVSSRATVAAAGIGALLAGAAAAWIFKRWRKHEG